MFRPRSAAQRVLLGAALLTSMACSSVGLVAATTTTTFPTPPASAPARGLGPVDLGALRVAPEEPGGGYQRKSFLPAGWQDLDGDGCFTRADVLIRDSRTQPTIAPICKVIRGDWISLYDGDSTSDPRKLEIDHIVALSEAWRSGASAWPDERRQAFAQDEDNLTPVTKASNQAKSDSDPARWRPSNRSSWCTYSRRWIDTKVRWNLTADEAEVRALTEMRRDC